MLDLHYSDVIPMMKETGAMQFDIQSCDFAFTDALPRACTHTTHATRRTAAYCGASRIIRDFIRGSK